MRREGAAPLTHTEKCRRVRAKRRAKGQCWFCTNPVAPGSRGLCLTHLERIRIRERVTPETGTWRPGGVGRPPLWSKRQPQEAA